MYGRVFEKMYEGSMAGAGLNVFALWNYILTKARRGVVEINPKLVAFTLGGETGDLSEVIKQVEDALEYLQRPDPESRSHLEDGKRIIKEGQFQYRIVNWDDYEKIRQEAENREYNRFAQAKHRQKIQSNSKESRHAIKFQKPSVLEIEQSGLSRDEAEKFFHYYESKGWLVGKSPMKNWKSAVSGWKSRSGSYGPPGASNGNYAGMNQEEMGRKLLEESQG